MAELKTEYYTKDEISPLTKEEKSLSYYIYRNSPNEDYCSLIKDDNRYFIKYNFSDYRSATLRWYPFNKESSVLEVNAEYGALTGALCDACKSVVVTEKSLFRANLICERYKNRKNLIVYAADYQNVQFETKFDYIVFFRTLETVADSVKCLNYLRTLLKPDGVLLLEVENKYGIQYIAGKKETYSGIPFNSIANYPVLNFGRGFCRADIEEILSNSDFSYWRFYYPLPDAIAPTAIYTDEVKPKENMIERLHFSYLDNSSTVIADEIQLFKDAVKNDVYPFFSNHFIIEAVTSKSNLSNVNLALMSPWRARNKSFAVLIRNDSIVEKKGLFSDSKKYAKSLCVVTDELAKRGVNILPMRQSGNSLFMDFMNVDTVQSFLTKSALTNITQQKIFSIMDKIWENILRSSELSDECAFDTKGIDFGPILRKTYVEMITINCFLINDDILFFDQEFVKDNYPAKYVLWRSFQMLYWQQPKLENVISKKQIQEHYGILKEMETVFWNLEKDLGDSEIPYDIFYKNDITPSMMKQNRERLLDGNDGR